MALDGRLTYDLVQGPDTEENVPQAHSGSVNWRCFWSGEEKPIGSSVSGTSPNDVVQKLTEVADEALREMEHELGQIDDRNEDVFIEPLFTSRSSPRTWK